MLQVGGDVVVRRDPQRDQPAARPDRREQVLRRRRAEQPDRARWRLLDRLEQRVERLLGEPVGVLDDRHLPAPAGRGERRSAHQLPGLADAVGQSCRRDDLDVGMGPGHRRVALVTLPAAAGLALQCGGERPSGHGPAGARRPGEQPRVRHADRCRPAVTQGHRRRLRGIAEHADDGTLTDQPVEDAHCCTPCSVNDDIRIVNVDVTGNAGNSSSTRCRISSCACSAAVAVTSMTK